MQPTDTDSIANGNQYADTDSIELTEAGKHFLAVTQTYNRGVADAQAKFEQLLADAEPNANADAIAFYRSVTESVALLRANRVAGPYAIHLADDFPGNVALSATVSKRKRDVIESLLNIYADGCCDNSADPETSTERIAKRILDALAKPDEPILAISNT